MTIDAITIVLATTAGVAALALVRGVFLGYPDKAIPGDTMLSAKEQAIVSAASDTYFPRGGRLAPSGTDAGTVRYFEDTLRDANPRMRILIRLLLAFVEHAPWLMLRGRFTSLTPERRREVFLLWTSSEIYFLRIVVTSLRTLLSFGYMANAEVCRTIGAVSNATPFEAPPHSSRDEIRRVTPTPVSRSAGIAIPSGVTP